MGKKDLPDVFSRMPISEGPSVLKGYFPKVFSNYSSKSSMEADSESQGVEEEFFQTIPVNTSLENPQKTANQEQPSDLIDNQSGFESESSADDDVPLLPLKPEEPSTEVSEGCFAKFTKCFLGR